jgi:hypothetical protein
MINVDVIGTIDSTFLEAMDELFQSVHLEGCPLYCRIYEHKSSCFVEFEGHQYECAPYDTVMFNPTADCLSSTVIQFAEGWRRWKMLEAAPCTEPAMWLVHTSRYFREWLDQIDLGVTALRWEFINPWPGVPLRTINTCGRVFADMKGPGTRGSIAHNKLSTEIHLVGEPSMKFSDAGDHRFEIHGQTVPETLLTLLDGTKLDLAIDHPRTRGLDHAIKSAHLEGHSLVVTIESDRMSLVDIPARAMSAMPSDANPWAPWQLRDHEIVRVGAATAALAALGI